MEVSPLFIGKIEIVNIYFQSDKLLKELLPKSLLQVQEYTPRSSNTNLIDIQKNASKISEKFFRELEENGRLSLRFKYPLDINFYLNERQLLQFHYSEKDIFWPKKLETNFNEISNDEFSKILLIDINTENHVKGFKYKYLEPIYNALNKAVKDLSKTNIVAKSNKSHHYSIVTNSVFIEEERATLDLTKKCIHFIIDNLAHLNKNFENGALTDSIEKTESPSGNKSLNEDLNNSNSSTSAIEGGNRRNEQTPKKHKNKSYHHMNTDQVIQILKQYFTLKREKKQNPDIIDKLSNIYNKKIKKKTIDSYLCLFRKIFIINSGFLNFLESSIGNLQKKVKNEWIIKKPSNIDRKSTKTEEFADWILNIHI